MSSADRPNTIPWPPILLIVVAAAAFALDYIQPAAELVGHVPPGLRPIGVILVFIAIFGDIWALQTMWKADTNILPNKAADRLVRTGPFAYSRNPIYASNTLALFGLSLALNNTWLIYSAVAFAVLVQKLAIKPEEEHLAAKFGKEWEAYKQAVPRWLTWL